MKPDSGSNGAFVGPAILVSVGYMDPGTGAQTFKAALNSSMACCG